MTPLLLNLGVKRQCNLSEVTVQGKINKNSKHIWSKVSMTDHFISLQQDIWKNLCISSNISVFYVSHGHTNTYKNGWFLWS